MDIIQKQEMINIEQEFYDTFGIEKRCTRPKDCVSKGRCRSTDACDLYTYPEITDRILLKMICVLSQSYPLNYEGWSFYTVQELKETILEDCINTAKKLSLSSVFANNIQQLFKGVNNNENR